MIAGLGTDIVEVSRMSRSLSKGDAFKKLVFHADEQTYCEAKGHPSESYAGRYAAKEAFLKALGTGWKNKIHWNEIVIRNNAEGQPILSIEGETLQTLVHLRHTKIHLSISHSRETAIAVVILES